MEKVEIIKDTPNGNQSKKEKISRMAVIGQNGNDGLHYEDKKLDKDLFGNPLHNDNGC